MDTKLKNLIIQTDFEQLFQKMNYAYFTKGLYNLNIIGVRNLLSGNKQDNTFNDALVLIYKENDNVLIKDIWEITTDPGIKSLKSFSNTKGCAILVPGQYRGAYQIGLHQGKYEALVQRKPVKVFRDGNKDDILDFCPKTIDEGLFGINIHRSNPNTESTIVDGWSAGCQVYKKADNFNEFMKVCHKAKDIYGNSFTYTLITTDDLV